MYVCICSAVTETDVRRAVEGGVRNLRQLAAETGCSNRCGRCARTAMSVLAAALQDEGRLLAVVEASRVA